MLAFSLSLCLSPAAHEQQGEIDMGGTDRDLGKASLQDVRQQEREPQEGQETKRQADARKQIPQKIPEKRCGR